MTGRPGSVAVVGGGISGLAAAHRLRALLGSQAQITVLETDDRLGGKLRTVELAGHQVDVGAEAFIARRPEVPDLLTELGLVDQLVTPAGRSPMLRAGGRNQPMPARTLMGIPSDAQSVAAVVGPDTLARIEAEPATPLSWDPGADMSVGELVARRFGREVVERSVDPLLGGVYSGSADTIGVRAALPTLAAALDAGAPSLIDAVARALPPQRPGPVFGALRDGYGALVAALAARSGARTLLGTKASGLRKTATGWWIDPVGEVDAVVLAVPAPALTALLAGPCPEGARAAGAVQVASSAVIALALPASAPVPEHSGLLVATGESLTAKAFTFSSRKWPHLEFPDATMVRVSVGRFGDSAVVEADDDWLVSRARADLATATGVEAAPLAAHVQRWHGGLPQYAAGHLAVVDRIDAAVASLSGLAVAGATFGGVGVPACVARAHRVVDELVTQWAWAPGQRA
ncbi:protoporphyrinogen oxidase [Rhodococcus sp. D2-41]|uniref:protoporphyrinogen oxidase n=1 Tax=Speluncibacter jeojiensis TaxID=2710754 RepID=UPI0024101E26|nr:protoporphyrinogen oxidase [Rhodococcus sp. D2-41]MDG3011375.1 protoporphyrinogen oxidase [Rhodococcus sp. D2-41]